MLRKILLGLILVVVVVALAAVVGLRVMRGRSGTPVEVAQGVWGVESGGSWVYAAAAKDVAVLIDAGGDPEGRGVDKLLAKLGLSRDRVADVYVTHGHFDHVAGAALFPKAQIHAGADDADLIAGREAPAAFAARVFSWLAPVPPAKVTDRLKARTVMMEPGGATVVAVPLPGHTPGSYAYLFNGVLFVGDAIGYGEGRLAPPPAAFTVDEAENRRSIVALAKLADPLPYDVVCTGHGGCTPAGGKKLLDAYVK
jgi:glyoxylase-like metal-dependent hydrolase (beta-lactamase superfamily II)